MEPKKYHPWSDSDIEVDQPIVGQKRAPHGIVPPAQESDSVEE